ncbi:MAG: zinc-binding alcohol dehydrogenase [Planctomycetes bacterium]|nr:zinc-binding alcohol dehydrogenase [Planctomycetota bacterium]
MHEARPQRCARRAEITAPGQVRMAIRTIPDPAPGVLLVRNQLSLVSPGTELAWFCGTHPTLSAASPSTFPRYPGYTSVGMVVATGGTGGTGGTVPGFAVGDRVFHCGSHADWTLVDPSCDQVLPLPPACDAHDALLAHIAQIAATATAVARPSPTVAVYGAGLVGILAAQWFMLAGSRVVVIDVNQARRQHALDCGIPHAADPSQSVARILGEDPACVVEATGDPQVIARALELVARRGEVILLGSPRGRVDLDAYELVHRRGARLIGAHASVLPPVADDGGASHRALILESLTAFADGRLKRGRLISRTIAPGELQSAYEGLVRDKDRWLGVVIDWSQEAA